jgi:hypothetical protein
MSEAQSEEVKNRFRIRLMTILMDQVNSAPLEKRTLLMSMSIKHWYEWLTRQVPWTPENVTTRLLRNSEKVTTKTRNWMQAVLLQSMSVREK